MDRGVWWATVHGVTKSQTWLSTHALINGHNILGSYAILLFTASDFTFVTSHIHNWALCSGAISNCLLLFLSSILDTIEPGSGRGSPFGGISFCLFILFMGFLWQDIGVGCHFLLQRTTFCQNSSLWLICLGWPCMAWLRASLSHTNPSARQGCDPFERDIFDTSRFFSLNLS